MNNCIVNEQGELLEILQEEREPQTGEHIVPLDGYYEVFNVQHYSQAVWDFTENKWKGVGEPNIPPEPQPSEVDILKEKVESQEILINELLTEIIPNIAGGN